jgi:hypothetical protein
MSNTTDLIFYCRVCFKGISTEKSADKDQPPFWVTSCGHVVCSEHVFPNGSEFASPREQWKTEFDLITSSAGCDRYHVYLSVLSEEWRFVGGTLGR